MGLPVSRVIKALENFDYEIVQGKCILLRGISSLNLEHVL